MGESEREIADRVADRAPTYLRYPEAADGRRGIRPIFAVKREIRGGLGEWRSRKSLTRPLTPSDDKFR